jgi:hypothetical protein
MNQPPTGEIDYSLGILSETCLASPIHREGCWLSEHIACAVSEKRSGRTNVWLVWHSTDEGNWHVDGFGSYHFGGGGQLVCHRNGGDV